jgi:N-acetylmuramic acid 6-phosphate etherase
MDLDRLTVAGAVRLMLSEESRVPARVLSQSRQIERAIRLIVQAFRRGGRLFYVGAGTSGRLGVLDASECPPTFQTPPQCVQGIIAGGELALRNSVEGAEDDPAAGRAAIDGASVGSRDVVVGIAASGTTPFVWGAIGEAKRRRAKTALLCFNPFLRIPRRLRPDVLIAPNIGPEVLTGSTRLKAGTATKLVLNLLTTVSMVRIGKVMSNLMVDVRPANQKLRRRAVRIVEGLTGVPAAAAELALARSGWDVRRAVRGLVHSDARRTNRASRR